MARRGRSQARRNPGTGGLPGWAWAVLGALVAVVLMIVTPRLLESEGDGFFRPQPNPDARPAPVAAGADDVVVPEGGGNRAAPGDEPRTGPEYDFYTLLPGREVPVSDAELAATERAEAQRLEALERRQSQDPAEAAALPRPVSADDTAATSPRDSADAALAPDGSGAVAGDGTRYLLQAGAFKASGQAEELKARIALLGLGARVESAQIGGNTVYRVRMGPYGTASDLAEAKRKLENGGLPAMAIKVQ
ncbi:SPOR domain-containing protein [Lysobacter sp. D1-1-M9]|uniref:SPOR domain-containing protein n=1 Tax=Novilysobacter longmucuonensis TaxID=3098603 RepID=UPI002FC960AB